MTAGFRCELTAIPIRPSAFELEAGELGHKVELTGPEIAVRCAGDSRVAAIVETAPEAYVMRDHVLTKSVISINEEVARPAHLDRSLMTRSKCAQLRDPQLDDEAAAGDDVPGRIAEALNLPLPSEEVGDRVEHEERQ